MKRFSSVTARASAAFGCFCVPLLVTCLVAASSSQSAFAQTNLYTWITIAGQRGHYGYNDGVGLAAQFEFPAGMAADGNGNVYVSDMGSGSGTVRKVGPFLNVTTVAGTPNGYGLDDPTSVAVDPSGNLFVADLQRVSAVGPSKALTTIAGGGTNTATKLFGFNMPIAVDTNGTLYIGDQHAIRRVGTGGVMTEVAGTLGGVGTNDGVGTSARFAGPSAMTFDSAGNLIIADVSRVRIMKPDTTVITLAGRADQSGSVDGVGTNATFGYLCGIGVDGAGNIFVADSTFFTIRRITPSGEVTTIGGQPGQAGSLDGVGTAALFFPSGLTADKWGNLFISDSTNRVVRLGVRNLEPPKLATIYCCGQINLACDASVRGFQVERSLNLGPTAAWFPLPNDSTRIYDTHLYFSDDLIYGRAFYRLHSP